jgi:hypothetical protein
MIGDGLSRARAGQKVDRVARIMKSVDDRAGKQNIAQTPTGVHDQRFHLASKAAW